MSLDSGLSANALVIFVRNAVIGNVKQRLAMDIGDAAALDVYQSLLLHTWQVTSQVAATRYVYYSDHLEHDDIWDVHTYLKRVQSGMDLGARMCNAINETLAHHRNVVLIGSDLPGLDTQILAEAFDALRYAEVVIGPAVDGGYYLLGCKGLHPSLFEDIDWGTGRVFVQTRDRLLAQHLNFKILESKRDIDTVEDLTQTGWAEQIV